MALGNVKRRCLRCGDEQNACCFKAYATSLFCASATALSLNMKCLSDGILRHLQFCNHFVSLDSSKWTKIFFFVIFRQDWLFVLPQMEWPTYLIGFQKSVDRSEDFVPFKDKKSDGDAPLWTKPWRNYFEFFEIMVSNDSLDPETLYQHV